MIDMGQVTVDGRPAAVTLEPGWDGGWQVLVDGRQVGRVRRADRCGSSRRYEPRARSGLPLGRPRRTRKQAVVDVLAHRTTSRESARNPGQKM